jgi:hypothetical protein
MATSTAPSPEICLVKVPDFPLESWSTASWDYYHHLVYTGTDGTEAREQVVAELVTNWKIVHGVR